MSTQSQLLDAVHRNDSIAITELLHNTDITTQIVNSNGFTQLLQLASNKPTHNVLQALLYAVITQVEDKKQVTSLLSEYVHNCITVKQQLSINGTDNIHYNALQNNTRNDINNSSISPGQQLKQQLQSLSLKERVEQVINAVGRGEIVIVLDSADRENEGDLIIASEYATPDKIAFIVNHSSGIICVGITPSRCKQLDLPAMVNNNTDPKQTAFTVSIDYKYNTTTGISAHDRALTIAKLSDENIKPTDFNRPGHVFPLKAMPGGVLVRPGLY